ncbi:MAG: hypothetical protein WC788_08240 [Candidatus Paceibacterota bacterium]|jgi:hypothetical protein
MISEIIKDLVNAGFNVIYIMPSTETSIKQKIEPVKEIERIAKDNPAKRKYKKKTNEEWRHEPRVGKAMKGKIKQCRIDGYSSEEAAKELGISIESVNEHWTEPETL